MATGETLEQPMLIIDRAARLALGVGPEATPEEIQSAFFRKLEACAFLPDESLHDAFLFLINQKVSPGSEFMASARQENAERLDQEISAFGARMFELNPVERREHWNTLRTRCEWFAPQLRRILKLAAGLDIDTHVIRSLDPDPARLAREILRIFPLDWPVKERCRQQLVADLLNEPSPDPRRWIKTTVLRKQAPAITMLDPALLDQLTAASASRSPKTIKIKTAKPAPQPQQPMQWGRFGWLVAIGIVGLFRVLSHTASPERGRLATQPPPAIKVDANAATPSALPYEELTRRAVAVETTLLRKGVTIGPKEAMLVVRALPEEISSFLARQEFKSLDQKGAEVAKTLNLQLSARGIMTDDSLCKEMLGKIYRSLAPPSPLAQPPLKGQSPGAKP